MFPLAACRPKSPGNLEVSLLGNVIGTGEKTWGETMPGSYLKSQKFTAVAGTIGDIRIRSTGSANAKVAIYSDSGGNPDALLAYSVSTPVVAGWNTLQLNVQVSLTATSYWLVLVTDTTGRIQRVSAGGTGKSKPYTYSDPFSNPFNLVGTSPETYDYAIAGWGLKVV